MPCVRKLLTATQASRHPLTVRINGGKPLNRVLVHVAASATGLYGARLRVWRVGRLLITSVRELERWARAVEANRRVGDRRRQTRSRAAVAAV
jgi:hypothetical protein